MRHEVDWRAGDVRFDADGIFALAPLKAVIARDIQLGDGLRERVERFSAFLCQDFGTRVVFLYCDAHGLKCAAQRAERGALHTCFASSGRLCHRVAVSPRVFFVSSANRANLFIRLGGGLITGARDRYR